MAQPRHTHSWFLLIAIFFLAFPSYLWAFTIPTSQDTPEYITVQGEKISLKTIKNPVSSHPESIKEGNKIYIKKCFLCHGDLLDGKGLFGESFIPSPANFTANNSIVSKTPAYAFWRIMKGGKGLPEKFQPWNSAMPAWEKVLSKDEVWKTILYINETVKEHRQKSKKIKNLQ